MKINKAVDNNVVMLCKNCYKEIKKSCGKISKYNEYVHKETGYMYCTLNQYILDSKAELLEVSILCKHCNKPIIKCYRCYHNKCLANGYLHVYTYTKNGVNLNIDYNPHSCYYDEFNINLMAEPE